MNKHNLSLTRLLSICGFLILAFTGAKTHAVFCRDCIYLKITKAHPDGVRTACSSAGNCTDVGQLCGSNKKCSVVHQCVDADNVAIPSKACCGCCEERASSEAGGQTCESPFTAPTLSGWAAIELTLLLLAAGTIVFFRKRTGERAAVA